MRRPPPTSTLFPYTTLFRSDFEHLRGPARDIAQLLVGPRSAPRRPHVLAHEGVRPARRNQDPERHARSEEHTSELQSPDHLVCRLLLEKKKKKTYRYN